MILAGCGTGGADQPAVTPQAGTDGQSASATLDNTTEESESSRQSPAVDDEELASAERVSGEEALLTNARLYADAVGISLEDALAQFQVQEELGRLELEPALRATAGDDFAGIWIQRDPAGAGDCGAGGGGRGRRRGKDARGRSGGGAGAALGRPPVEAEEAVDRVLVPEHEDL